MEAAGRNIFGKRFASLRRAGRAMMETGKADGSSDNEILGCVERTLFKRCR
jgi:hypothetical protein